MVDQWRRLLDVLRNGNGGVPTYNDLGEGTGYGSVMVSDADEQMLVFISLNAIL